MCLAWSYTLGIQMWGNKLVFAHKSVIICKSQKLFWCYEFSEAIKQGWYKKKGICFELVKSD